MPVDWRNSALIICFVIFTPYAWEYLAAFFSGIIPAGLVGELLVDDLNEHVNLGVILDSIVNSLFACVIIAVPCGAITNKQHLRNALVYAGLSTVHLIVVFVFERISVTTFYWPLVVVEIIAFFIWLYLATLAGAVTRKFYRKFA